jgi:mRNA-degrading endonuclease RelE of RelBE toxin-antitoxin system
MDIRFHCSKRVRQSGKKAKHEVFAACKTVCDVLRLNPLFGVSIPRFHDLHKMRIRIPGYKVGKSGGYRLIYRAKEMDEAIHIVFLEVYSKSECEDLVHSEYLALTVEAENILSDPLRYDWE